MSKEGLCVKPKDTTRCCGETKLWIKANYVTVHVTVHGLRIRHYMFWHPFCRISVIPQLSSYLLYVIRYLALHYQPVYIATITKLTRDKPETINKGDFALQIHPKLTNNS